MLHCGLNDENNFALLLYKKQMTFLLPEEEMTGKSYERFSFHICKIYLVHHAANCIHSLQILQLGNSLVLESYSLDKENHPYVRKKVLFGWTN